MSENQVSKGENDFSTNTVGKSYSTNVSCKRKVSLDLTSGTTRDYEESFEDNQNFMEPNPDKTLRSLHLEAGRISHEMGTLLQNFSQRKKSMEYYRDSLQLTIRETETAHLKEDMSSLGKMETFCKELESQYKEMFTTLSSNESKNKLDRESFATFPFMGDVCMSFFYSPLSSQDYEKEHFSIIGNACTLYNMAILNYADGRREHAAKLLNMSSLTIDENCKGLAPGWLRRMQEDILSLQAMIQCNLGYIYYEGDLYEESLFYFQSSLAHFDDLAKIIKVRMTTQNQKETCPIQPSDYDLRSCIKCDLNAAKVLLNKIFCIMKTESYEEVLKFISSARRVVNNLDAKLESNKELILMTETVEAIAALERQMSSPKDSSSTKKLSKLLQDVNSLICETRQHLGTMHPLFHTLQGILGNIFRALGHMRESKIAHRICLSLCRKIHGESHALTSSSLINLGLSMYYQDELRDSLDVLQAALKIQKDEIEMTGEIRLDFLKTKFNIGQVWYARGFLQKAVDVYKQLFQEAREKLGPANNFVVDLLQILALVLYEMGRTGESMRYFIQSTNTLASMNRLYPDRNTERNLGFSQMFSFILQNRQNGMMVQTQKAIDGSDHQAAAA